MFTGKDLAATLIDQNEGWRLAPRRVPDPASFLSDWPYSLWPNKYIVRGEQLTMRECVVDFDVITELTFTDREALQAWMAQLLASGKVAADEAKFLDRAKTRAYVVEEHVTSG